MPAEVAHKHWWQIFEVVFGVPFLVGIALQFIVPLAFPRGFFTPVVIAGGVSLIGLGVACVILARRELARHNQPSDPGRPTSRLVTSGIFSVSRNPLYLGGVCILAGIALALDLPWNCVMLVPSMLACHYVLIAPEERYLSTTFGRHYSEYAATVGRWIGRA